MDNNKKVKLWTKDFVLIIVINFFVFLNHLMIFSTFPFFVSHLGYSDTVSGICAAVFSFVAVICRPFIGWMLDTGRRKRILLTGICGMLLVPVGYLAVLTAVASIALTVFFRMAHGCVFACSNTSTSTVATDILPKPRFAEGMGMFGMATALATACAPAVGEALMSKGFGVLFLSASVIMAVCLVLFAFLKVPSIPQVQKRLSFKELIDRDALPASVVVLVFLMTYGALENYTLKFAAEEEAITLSGGIYFTVMAVMLFLTRVLVGKAADRRGEEIFVYTCNSFMFAALILLALVPNNVTFLLSAALSGYAFGGLEPALQAMAVSIAPPERRGAANSTFLCAYDIGIGIGGGLAGILIDAAGYEKMYLIIAASTIISVIIYVIWGRKHLSSMTYRIRHRA